MSTLSMQSARLSSMVPAGPLCTGVTTCTVPGSRKEDRIPEGRAELGLGIHGEAGIEQVEASLAIGVEKLVSPLDGNDLMHLMQAMEKMSTAFIIEIICAIVGFVLAVIGIAAAVYLEEYANRERWWNRMIEVNIQNLAAVPAIVPCASSARAERLICSSLASRANSSFGTSLTPSTSGFIGTTPNARMQCSS